MWYPVKRTPEQGHEPKCLAQAMITAIENIRDLEGVGLECICPPPEDDGKDSFSG
jgi:hypothetical protein